MLLSVQWIGEVMSKREKDVDHRAAIRHRLAFAAASG